MQSADSLATELLEQLTTNRQYLSMRFRGFIDMDCLETVDAEISDLKPDESGQSGVDEEVPVENHSGEVLDAAGQAVNVGDSVFAGPEALEGTVTELAASGDHVFVQVGEDKPQMYHVAQVIKTEKDFEIAVKFMGADIAHVVGNAIGHFADAVGRVGEAAGNAVGRVGETVAEAPGRFGEAVGRFGEAVAEAPVVKPVMNWINQTAGDPEEHWADQFTNLITAPVVAIGSGVNAVGSAIQNIFDPVVDVARDPKTDVYSAKPKPVGSEAPPWWAIKPPKAELNPGMDWAWDQQTGTYQQNPKEGAGPESQEPISSQEEKPNKPTAGQNAADQYFNNWLGQQNQATVNDSGSPTQHDEKPAEKPKPTADQYVPPPTPPPINPHLANDPATGELHNHENWQHNSPVPPSVNPKPASPVVQVGGNPMPNAPNTQPPETPKPTNAGPTNAGPTCNYCNGTGRTDGRTCLWCDGSGHEGLAAEGTVHETSKPAKIGATMTNEITRKEHAAEMETVACPMCSGDGKVGGDSCLLCDGRREVTPEDAETWMAYNQSEHERGDEEECRGTETCPVCSGASKVNGDSCPFCNGHGSVSEEDVQLYDNYNGRRSVEAPNSSGAASENETRGVLCPSCGGSGEYGGSPCMLCEGGFATQEDSDLWNEANKIAKGFEAPTKFQAVFGLEPVTKDWDGTLVPINDAAPSAPKRLRNLISDIDQLIKASAFDNPAYSAGYKIGSRHAMKIGQEGIGGFENPYEAGTEDYSAYESGLYDGAANYMM